MTAPLDSPFARLLAAWSAGDRAAGAELFSAAYGDLHRIAKAHMSAERPNHTLQPTALVNETWLRLLRRKSLQLKSHGEFLYVASATMRRVLIDHARKAGRRDPVRPRSSEPLELLEDHRAGRGVSLPDLIDLDSALARLWRIQPASAQLIELRYFVGLKKDEAARSLGISPSSAALKLSAGLAWLRDYLSRGS